MSDKHSLAAGADRPMPDGALLPLYPQSFRADEAYFLAWHDLEGAAGAALLAAVDFGGEFPAAKEVERVRVASLPCYPARRLVAVSVVGSPQDRFCLIGIDRPGECRWLDGTNEPIYALNAEDGITLSRETIPGYARFFFHFVRGALGSFRIVEPDRPIPWRGKVGTALRRRIEDALLPLTYLGRDRDGLHRLMATVLFKQALFRTDILVAERDTDWHNAELGGPEHCFRSEVKLTNEDLLEEDLPI